ncbi:MAG: hypothetical protein J3K34DRAFT_19064 [Monoraphidium minutum]|nr:MAG: hypothetical protein J3K34DRAFT_19064 [Monoraphidium minutum]
MRALAERARAAPNPGRAPAHRRRRRQSAPFLGQAPFVQRPVLQYTLAARRVPPALTAPLEYARRRAALDRSQLLFCMQPPGHHAPQTPAAWPFERTLTSKPLLTFACQEPGYPSILARAAHEAICCRATCCAPTPPTTPPLPHPHRGGRRRPAAAPTPPRFPRPLSVPLACVCAPYYRKAPVPPSARLESTSLPVALRPLNNNESE